MPPRELKLSDRHLRALGRINADFQLEFVLIGALGGLLQDEQVGSIIGSYLPFRGLTDLFDALFRHEYPAALERMQELAELIRSIRTVQDERNQFIHSSWAAEPSGGHYWRRKYGRGSPVPKVEEVAATTMEALAAEIRRLITALESFIEGITAPPS